jgi:hypothetical protein
VLATWLIRQPFWNFRQKFRQSPHILPVLATWLIHQLFEQAKREFRQRTNTYTKKMAQLALVGTAPSKLG